MGNEFVKKAGHYCRPSPPVFFVIASVHTVAYSTQYCGDSTLDTYIHETTDQDDIADYDYITVRPKIAI